MHDQVKARSRREIPAVNKVLDALGHYDLPRPLVVDLVRRELSRLRVKTEIPEFRSIVDLVRRSLAELRASRLRPVINGTGIVIHTNLGRAPLPAEAIRALCKTGSTYSNLEYDLETSERGGRGNYIEKALALLCEAESATVVNNCAAALVLIVRHFTRNKPEIVISRGELIQIGGGFRIGEIIEAAGAKLREVGATNKTTLNDYAKAIGPNTALILKVHRSNFFMSGFVESASSAAIAALARKKRVPFVEDLGSGAIVATERLGIAEHEPTPAEALKDGADLVCSSGDKLFGGPQAGIIAGKKRFIAALKREPLFRALRCDKLIFAALQATVDLHLNQSTSVIPAIALLQVSEDELRARAKGTAPARRRCDRAPPPRRRGPRLRRARARHRAGRRPPARHLLSPLVLAAQIKRLGSAYDWRRELSCCEPDYYQWTQWLFVQLHKAGLAYKQMAPVNWCPSCQTVLANEQAEGGTCDRCGTEVVKRDLEQWMFRITDYAQQLIDDLDTVEWPERVKVMQRNWIGRSEGVEFDIAVRGSDTKIRVFTTRIDTVFGMTYAVLAPEHPLVPALTAGTAQEREVAEFVARVRNTSEVERQSAEGQLEKRGIFTGAYAINPFNGAEVPLYLADYVLGSYGTGAIMAVPGEDQRDFDFAVVYELPVIKTTERPEGWAEQIYTGPGRKINSGLGDDYFTVSYLERGR